MYDSIEDVPSLPEDFDFSAEDIEQHLSVIEDRRQSLTAALDAGVSTEDFEEMSKMREALVIAARILEHVRTLAHRAD